MLYFKYLMTPPPSTTVYAPLQHQEIIHRIYTTIGASAEFRTSSPLNLQIDGHGHMAVMFSRAFGFGLIRVQRIGTDTPAEIFRARHDLCELAGADVVYLELPLAQTGTPAMCNFAEEIGFFISGIGPHFASDGDVLRLQYLNTEIDMNHIQIYNTFGKELLTYIEKEKSRVDKQRQ